MDKSMLAYQIEGRLGSYLGAIDSCQSFVEDNSFTPSKTMDMPSSIHSLLHHIQSNCLEENRQFIEKIGTQPKKKQESYFSFSWTPIQEAEIIAGVALFKFNVPNLDYFSFSKFKSISLESFCDVIINLMTLTLAEYDDNMNISLYVVKKKDSMEIEPTNIDILKNEIEQYCPDNKNNPTVIYNKYKDFNGKFGNHFSNFNWEIKMDM